MQNEIKNIPLEEANLSVRAYNCLKRFGISNLNQLEEYSENELKNMRNLGQKALNELYDVCRANGIVIDGKRQRLLQERLRYREELKKSNVYTEAQKIIDTAGLLYEDAEWYNRQTKSDTIEALKIAYLKDIAGSLKKIAEALEK